MIDDGEIAHRATYSGSALLGAASSKQLQQCPTLTTATPMTDTLKTTATPTRSSMVLAPTLPGNLQSLMEETGRSGHLLLELAGKQITVGRWKTCLMEFIGRLDLERLL